MDPVRAVGVGDAEWGDLALDIAEWWRRRGDSQDTGRLPRSIRGSSCRGMYPGINKSREARV